MKLKIMCLKPHDGGCQLISGIMLVVAAHVVADWEKVAMAE